VQWWWWCGTSHPNQSPEGGTNGRWCVKSGEVVGAGEGQSGHGLVIGPLVEVRGGRKRGREAERSEVAGA